jgi:acyl-CoA reductase-like NAD-dependent aldehyde dehydrogenase
VKAANFIGGEWLASAGGRTYEKRNPFRTADVVAEFPASEASDVDAAVDAATQTRRMWAELSPQQRGAILFRAADVVQSRVGEIAGDMTREMGKPIRESSAEVSRGADQLRFYAGEGWRAQGEIFTQSATGNQVQVLRRPLGVVGLICPWNFPFSIPLWKAAPALAYGNCVVLKAASEAPAGALHLAACLHEAGLPPGVFNVVVGRGGDVGTPLVKHPGVRAISFTGSVGVGEQVRQEAVPLGKRVQLELGGHSPLVVMDDADLERASEAAFAGAFWSAGQKCTATRRIYVQQRAYDPFRVLLTRRIERGAVGDPTDPVTEVGPLVSEQQLTDVLGAIERGVHEGGTLVRGGERLGDDGFMVAPALFENVAQRDFLSQEEVFGPVTSLYRFAELDEAIEQSNSTRFGLSASIFTPNSGTVQRFVAGIEAGVVRVNAATAGGEPHVPFGGSKGSGYGPREQGRAARDFYTETVTVYQNP